MAAAGLGQVGAVVQGAQVPASHLGDGLVHVVDDGEGGVEDRPGAPGKRGATDYHLLARKVEVNARSLPGRLQTQQIPAKSDVSHARNRIQTRGFRTREPDGPPRRWARRLTLSSAAVSGRAW